MKKISEPIVFFGSGPVAAKSLKLLAADFTIEAVITKPRPAHHKGSVPVIELASKLSLKTLTAANKSELDALFASRPVRARLAVLIDFGIIVSQAVIDYFELGIVNSHFSLLPQWRGADPITFSILSGQPQTGVSLMLLTAGMDEGPLLGQAVYDLSSNETTPSLTEALIELSDHALHELLPLYITGNALPAAQEDVTFAPDTTPTYSRKLTKQDGNLDFHKPAVQLEREIRAFIEWPRSRTTIGNLDCVITASHVETGEVKEPGTLDVRRATKQLLFHCCEGLLAVDRLKPAGKAEMTVEAFLAGYGATLGL